MKFTGKSKIGNNGRFVIPGEIRRHLNLKEGDHVQVGIEDGRVVILTAELLLNEFFELSKHLRASPTDVIQELIDERRQEAAQETTPRVQKSK